jgi:tetratricopeptide (TPR) repeat protein
MSSEHMQIHHATIAALCALLTMMPAPALAQQGDVGQQAQEHSDLATKLFLERDFAAAVVEFYKAYELQPAPLLLYNIAICYQSMGDMERAAEALGRALAHEDISATEQAAARARLLALHVFEVTHQPAEAASEVVRAPVAQAPVQGTPGWYSGLMWGAAGLGAAGLGGALLINYSISDDIMAYEDARRSGRATQRAADAISADQRLGKGLLAVGGTMAIASGLLWLLNPWDARDGGQVSFELMLTPQTQGVWVSVPLP